MDFLGPIWLIPSVLNGPMTHPASSVSIARQCMFTCMRGIGVADGSDRKIDLALPPSHMLPGNGQRFDVKP